MLVSDVSAFIVGFLKGECPLKKPWLSIVFNTISHVFYWLGRFLGLTPYQALPEETSNGPNPPISCSPFPPVTLRPGLSSCSPRPVSMPHLPQWYLVFTSHPKVWDDEDRKMVPSDIVYLHSSHLSHWVSTCFFNFSKCTFELHQQYLPRVC